MKALLTVLLVLLQLQPVLGTAACLGLAGRPASQECTMSEHGQRGTIGLMPAGGVGERCQSAVICTPAPPAIPILSTRLETAASSPDGPGALTATLPRDLPPVPPFHPPRA